MKYAAIVLTVCCLIFCGCASTAVQGTEEGVLFNWDSAATPMRPIFAGDSARSGFGKITFRAAGRATLETVGGAFIMGKDVRLLIGCTSDGVTSAATHIPGQFDLSEGTFRLTIDWKDPLTPSGTNYLFRIYLNNNHTGGAESVLGRESVLSHYVTQFQMENSAGSHYMPGVIETSQPGRIVLEFTPSLSFENASPAAKASLKTAFFSLQSQLESRLTITGIRLERVQQGGEDDSTFVSNVPVNAVIIPQQTGDVVYYSQFGAKGDGVSDDFDCIIAAHEAANKAGVKVRADQGAVYYIGPMRKTARVETETDWTGAEFIIDDSIVTRSGSSWNDTWIFDIVSAQRPSAVTSVSTLKKNQAKLEITLPSRAVIAAVNTGVKHYIRRGVNQNVGNDQTDVFIVDRNGNIDQTAPIIWDFDRLTSLTAYPIDETVLTVRGGKFTTIANKGHADFGYMKRGIHVERSNTVIDGLTHLITGEGEQGSAYYGFIMFENCMNAAVKNTVFTGHRGYTQTNGPTRGTYDFNSRLAINVKLENCSQSNDINNPRYWGVFVSNYSKNITLDKCTLSRIDAHCGVHNVTVLNSEIGYQRINVVGSGLLRVENTKVTGSAFIFLRDDYGSTWEGEIVIRNCTLVPRGLGQAAIIRGVNDGQWNFGFPCYLPETITIDGFVVEDAAMVGDAYYEGLYLIWAVNTGAREPYPYSLTKTIRISGYKSAMPWRMPNDYLRDKIEVITR